VPIPGSRRKRAFILLVGVLAPQLLLFAPSLAGRKLLLPLDLLALPGVYLPETAEYRDVQPSDVALSDQVLLVELDRRFAAAEWRAGRVPLWRPSIFAGAPFAAHPKYSPFNLVYYAFPSPGTLAWIQLLKSLVAGLGAFLFFRRVLHAGFWPAAIGAWCYPVTGFFVYCLGMPITYVTAWLPWALLATDCAIRRPAGWGGPALALATGVVAISGQLDIAALVLLACGLHAAWCLHDAYSGRQPHAVARAAAAAVVASCAVLLGVTLAAIYAVPLLEYGELSARMQARRAGFEERPPGSIALIAQVLVPEFHGASRRGSAIVIGASLLESASGAYAGLIAAVLLAPLAWRSRPHRSITLFFAAVAFLGLSWQLGVPGVVALLRTPPLNLLSANRMVFVSAFAILSMAVVGLEVIATQPADRRRPGRASLVVLVALAIVCAWRAWRLPDRIADLPTSGRDRVWVPTPARKGEIQGSFRRTYSAGACLSALAAAGWLLLRSGRGARLLVPALGVALIGELVASARGVNPQCDPALYYPRIPVLEELARAPAGRTLCVGTLPANLAEPLGLQDIRGYDGLDPALYVQLLETVRDPRYGGPSYARTQRYVPRLRVRPPDRVELPGVIDMLGVRYVVFRGAAPRDVTPMLAGNDHWVLENRSALPRAYVPRRVERLGDHAALVRFASPDFDPREVAFVDRVVPSAGPGHGSARIVRELPAELTVRATLQAAGLVVVADQWDPGWKASVNGQPVPIVRANVALRGVVAPAGTSTIEMRYEPEGFRRGARLTGLALAALAAWTAVVGASALAAARRQGGDRVPAPPGAGPAE
jgi:hypothetical protein